MRTPPRLQGIFLIITAPVLAANLLADGPYVLLDLRVRQGRTQPHRPVARLPGCAGRAHGNAFGGIGCMQSRHQTTPRQGKVAMDRPAGEYRQRITSKVLTAGLGSSPQIWRLKI